MDKTFRLKTGEALLLTDESERRYFIDFDSSFGYVLITAEERVFYTDKRYLSAAKEKLAGWIVEEFTGLDAVAERIKKAGAKSVLIDFSVTTLTEYDKLKKMKFRFKDAGRRLESLFAVKSKTEIERIAKACSIADHMCGAS